MFDRQLDVFGDEHDIAPANERMRLFEPVRVMPGQTTMTYTNPQGVVFVASSPDTVRILEIAADL